MGKKETRYNAIADVGPIALAIVRNPAQEDALDWLTKILRGEIGCVIPLTTIMGAFIVSVNYLGAKPCDVAERLKMLVGAGKVFWYSEISVDIVKRVMKIAQSYSIDSWDAYLVWIMKKLNLEIIYTIDTSDFKKIEDIKPINPISPEKFKELQEWLRTRI